MKEQPPNQALGASETTHLFYTRISPARDGAFPVEGIQPAPTGETNHEPEISINGAATFRRPNRSIRRRRERWEMDDENSVRNNSLASDVMRPRDDENTLWTDSQDYGADEIL